jgi:nitroreductase
VFCFLERRFEAYQWLDLGIYLQTVRLLLTEAGYASCPQADWAMFERTVKFLNSPLDLGLVCGIAVGYPDEARPENLCRTERDDLLQSYEIR